MSPRWNPWRALRERASTTLAWSMLTGDVGLAEVCLGPDGSPGAETIVLDVRLGRRERRAVLAHELVHLERGVLPAGSPEPVVVREEHQVRAITVDRLVPPDDLARFVASRGSVGPVTAVEVGDEYDVPESIAAAALHRLRSNRLDGFDRASWDATT